jgi:hypothetical protein
MPNGRVLKATPVTLKNRGLTIMSDVSLRLFALDWPWLYSHKCASSIPSLGRTPIDRRFES